MLHDHTVLLSVSTNPFEPLQNTGEQLYLCSVTGKALTAENQLSFRLLHHFVHIGKIRVHIIFLRQMIRLCPERSDIISYRLNIALCLHIIRR